jgi:hypothetical protein
VTDHSYLNLETKEYVSIRDEDLDSLNDIVRATVEWDYAYEEE